MNILIVDDEPLAISRLQRLLASLGHSGITSASSAEEALFLSRDTRFDAAFLDISMSGMDGIDLGYALRERDPDLYIIYQTAHDTHALKAFNVGAIDYLLKPYTLDDLERALRRIDRPTSETPRFLSKSGDSQRLVRPDEIYYVKADLSEVIFRTKEGFCYYPKKISEIEPLLTGHGFHRIHRSYMINLDKIDQMETIDQSRIRFTFQGIKEYVDSSKEGAKFFRNRFKTE